MKENVDLKKYKTITFSNNEYRTFKNIKLNNIEIENNNKNILIRNNINEYIIKLSNKKINYNYDIIDCKYSNYVKIILLKNKVLIIN